MVQSFVGDEEDLEVDVFLYGEPVKVMEVWSDVVSGAGVGEQLGTWVLNIL